MTTNEHEACNNGCADCGCGMAEATQSEQTTSSYLEFHECEDTAPGISAINEAVTALEEDVDAQASKIEAETANRRKRLEEACERGAGSEVNSYVTVGKELREVIEGSSSFAGVITDLTSTVDLVTTLETVDPVAVIENVAAVIQQAKETVRIGAVDMSFSHQDDLILDRLIATLTKDGVEYPQLLNFIPPLESQRGTLLGEAVAYRDAHARAMTHFWTMLMSDVGNPATLAARARIDIGVLANYNDNAWMQWWDENIRPWCITYGHFFGPDEGESVDAPQVEG